MASGPNWRCKHPPPTHPSVPLEVTRAVAFPRPSRMHQADLRPLAGILQAELPVPELPSVRRRPHGLAEQATATAKQIVGRMPRPASSRE